MATSVRERRVRQIERCIGAMRYTKRHGATFIAALMLGVSVQAQAQPADAARCSDQDVKKLRRAWNIEPAVKVYDAVCRAWPDDGRLRLMSLIYDKGDSESRGLRSGWLALALVDAKTSHIVSRYRERLEEDARLEFDAGLVTFDTARYRLAPGVRAFGVALRLLNRASCADGGNDGAWRLFVPEGAAIRAVTNDQVHLHTWRFADGSVCRGEVGTEVGLTFDTKPRAGTWADLVITARRSDRKRPPLVVEVPYDGRSYRLERWRERFDRWYQ